MTLDMGNTDKLSEFRDEAKRVGIEVVPPSINRSASPSRSRVVPSIMRSRRSRGWGGKPLNQSWRLSGNRPFRDLADFANRVNPRTVNKRVLESLAGAGAFDELKKTGRVFAGVDGLLAAPRHKHDSVAAGALEFSFAGHDAGEPIRLPAMERWMPAERLQKEFDAIGFF